MSNRTILLTFGKFKTFQKLKITQRIYHNIKINFMGKHINPIYRSKTHKIEFWGIVKNVLSSHRLKIFRIMEYNNMAPYHRLVDIYKAWHHKKNM